MTPYRVALVGLGNAANHLHLPALAGLPDAALVGACDLDADRRAAAERRWGVATYADLDAMLDATRPEVVIVGTPPQHHAAACKRALAAGAHVLCEKPFAAGVDEVDRIIAAARTAGRRVALNHEFRQMPIFRAVLEAARRDPGELTFAQAWQVMDLPPWSEPGWRGQMAQRTLYEAGVHLVDYLLALYGERPVAVTATTSAGPGAVRDGDAIVLATLEFARGRLAQVVQHRLCKGDTQYFDVRVDTPAASYRASFGGRARLSAGLQRSTRPHFRVEYGVSGIAWREVGHRRTLLARNPKGPETAATRDLIARTLAAFRDGGRPPATAEDGRLVLEVIAACYQSAATGRRVALGDAAPAPEGVAIGAGLAG